MSTPTRRAGWPLTGLLITTSAFALLAALMQLGWGPLHTFDAQVGQAVRVTPDASGAVRGFWTWAGNLTDTPAMTAYTTLIVIMLAWRGHRRMAIWVAGVMLSAGLGNALLKLAFRRDRPVWDDPIQTLHSYSFPSGHSSGIMAFAGMVLVLAALFERTLLPYAVAGAGAVLLIGADRLVLGVHNISDVIAGYLLGAAIVFGWLLALPPRQHGILAGRDNHSA